MDIAMTDGTPSRRRRSRGLVTSNACTECRKRRAKCDGQTPCSSCTSRKVTDCVYEVPTRVSKENMRRDIEQLQDKVQIMERIINALAINDDSNHVIQQLRNRVSLEEISGRLENTFPPLKSRSSLQQQEMMSDTGQGLSLTPQSKYLKLYPPKLGVPIEPWLGAASTSQSRSFRGVEHEVGVEARWTGVTSDKALVNHLFTLYFCWEYPIFLTLSKEHFLADFQAGNPRYCSSLLVNALLAVGCRISAHQGRHEGPGSASTPGDRFFTEAKRLLARTRGASVTTVQALGLMSLHEAMLGRDSESWFYSGQSIQMAVEMGLNVDLAELDELTAAEREVRAITFWGSFTLDQIWSLSLGRLPHFSKYVARATKPLVIQSIKMAPWVPYGDDGETKAFRFEVSNNTSSIQRRLCELSELVHHALFVLYTPGGNLTGKDVLDLHTRYVEWFDSLPGVLLLNANPIPSIVFLHLYYQFALLMLFRPFMKLRFLASATPPVDVCIQAADNICSLVETYKNNFTLRYTPVFVTYILLASSVTHLYAFQSLPAGLASSPHILPEMVDLQAMCPQYPFARRAISILRFLARQWGVNIFFAEHIGEVGDRDALCRPVPDSMNFFCPDLEIVINSFYEPGATALFLPFPMQGLPLLDDGLARMERTELQLIG